MPSSGASININATGSESRNITTNYGVQQVADGVLNSLANGANVSGLVYDNASGATNAKVVITLQKVTPTAGANIQIDNGTSYYQIDVGTSSSAKRLEFWDIPATFLANFKIYNNLGVALAASGNTCVIYPV